jgi:ketosteroid isomerase-like protein
MYEHTLLTGKRIYESFAAGDLEGLAALCHPDVVLDVPGTHPNAGRWTGPDGVVGFVVASNTVAGATEHVELVDLLAGERHVAGLCRVTGERDGRSPLVNETVHLFEVDDDGLVTAIRFHNVDQAAVDAFWG